MSNTSAERHEEAMREKAMRGEKDRGSPILQQAVDVAEDVVASGFQRSKPPVVKPPRIATPPFGFNPGGNINPLRKGPTSKRTVPVETTLVAKKVGKEPVETTLVAPNEGREKEGGVLHWLGLAGGRKRRRKKSRKSKKKSKSKKRRRKSRRRSRRKRGRGGNEIICDPGFSWDSVAKKCLKIDRPVPVDHEGKRVKTWSAEPEITGYEKTISHGGKRRRKSRRKKRRKSNKRKSRRRRKKSRKRRR